MSNGIVRKPESVIALSPSSVSSPRRAWARACAVPACHTQLVVFGHGQTLRSVCSHNKPVNIIKTRGGRRDRKGGLYRCSSWLLHDPFPVSRATDRPYCPTRLSLRLSLLRSAPRSIFTIRCTGWFPVRRWGAWDVKNKIYKKRFRTIGTRPCFSLRA